MKKVIILTGMPGSGKSTAAIEFQKLKVPVIGMGDAVRKEMRRRGIEINNRSIRLFSKRMTKEHGNKYVSGLVKKEGYKPIILGIIADKQVRFKRIVKRKNESDFSSYSEFEWREKLELGYGIAEVIASADYYIDNMGSKEKFLNDIKKFLSKVKALK